MTEIKQMAVLISALKLAFYKIETFLNELMCKLKNLTFTISWNPRKQQQVTIDKNLKRIMGPNRVFSSSQKSKI